MCRRWHAGEKDAGGDVDGGYLSGRFLMSGHDDGSSSGYASDVGKIKTLCQILLCRKNNRRIQ